MSSIVKKNFDSPDEVRAPDKAKVHVCQLGDVAAARLTSPGWSWSTASSRWSAVTARPATSAP